MNRDVLRRRINQQRFLVGHEQSLRLRSHVHNKPMRAAQPPNGDCFKLAFTPVRLGFAKGPGMREQQIRSLLLLDANVDERRLVSAIASRAGWTVIGSADADAAAAHLKGSHGREVQAALVGSWNSEQGPGAITVLREQRATLSVIVLSNGNS